MSTETITHVVIARAGDAGPSGACAQATIGCAMRPDHDSLGKVREAIADAFYTAHGRVAMRIAVVVLPSWQELDETEDQVADVAAAAESGDAA